MLVKKVSKGEKNYFDDSNVNPFFGKQKKR